jgi:hypothetical protein
MWGCGDVGNSCKEDAMLSVLILAIAVGASAQVPAAVVVPAGTDLYVRLQAPLSSGGVAVGERFEVVLLFDVSGGDGVVIPAGAAAGGFVGSVRPARPGGFRASLTLAFDELRMGERVASLRASVVQALDPKMQDDASRIAGGGTAGVAGAMPVGGPGTLAGVIVDPSGSMTTAGSADVELPVGTVLRIRLTRPLTIPVVPASPA